MKEPVKSFERVNQKKRTRNELLRSARQLMEAGQQPSVADVADHAGISRATAYRYFSRPEDLLREAVLDRAALEIRVEPARPGDDVIERVMGVVSQVLTMLEKDEPMFRALLAGTVAANGEGARAGRRVDWLMQALEPLEGQVDKRELRRLTMALGLTCGIEALVAMKDACGLKSREAREVILWTVRTLVTSLLRPAGEAGAKPGAASQLRFDLG